MNVWRAPAAAGSLFAAGSAVAPSHDGAAFWLVRVDGAGPTDRRGAVRVPCESWAARLSSLGVATAPCALCNPNENPSIYQRLLRRFLPTRPHKDSLLTKSTHYSPGLYIDAQARLS